MRQGINRWRKDQVHQDKGKCLKTILLKCNKWPLVIHEELNKMGLQVKDLLQGIHNTEALHQDKAAHPVSSKEDHLQAIQEIGLQVKVDHHKVTQMLHKAKDRHHREDCQLAICSVTQIL